MAEPLTPPRRLVLVAALVLVLAGGPLLWRMLQSRDAMVDLPQDVAAAATAEVESPPAETGPAPPSAEATVTVHVIGGVRRPGLVVLPAGSRVADAIEACGGPVDGAAFSVNLARTLVDGEQLDVDAAAEPSAPAASGAPASTDGPLNLNTATIEQLDGLPGVGPALARRITDFRETNGPFTSVEQLQEVPGIGDRRLADLADLVTAGP